MFVCYNVCIRMSVYTLRLQPQRSPPAVLHEGAFSHTSISCPICLEAVEQVCMMCVFGAMTSDC